MYSETLTFIVSSACLNMSDPLGGASSATNEGTVHSLSAGASVALLLFCQNLGLTLSSVEDDDDDGVVSVDLLSSCFSKLVPLKVKHRNIRLDNSLPKQNLALTYTPKQNSEMYLELVIEEEEGVLLHQWVIETDGWFGILKKKYSL